MRRSNATRYSGNTLASRPRVNLLDILVFCAFASAAPAHAYTQNLQLERDLDRSDPKALMLFPAKGYVDGAAGFFRTHGLHVVPDSQRAWCTNNRHGVLKPGCYVELFVQGDGMRERDQY